MAALNLCFFNIDGAVVCGDSLAMTKRRAWKTRGTMLCGEVAEVDPDDLPWPEAAFDEPANDDDRPTLRIGDYVIDREDDEAPGEDASVMLVVELTLERADAVFIDDGTTVADVNADQYATDDVVRVIHPLAGQTHVDNHEPYSFPRGRLKRTATVHSDGQKET